MPLFDIRGARRALPVATTQPDDASFAAATRAVISEHLSTLLGEPVVTVAEKPRSTADLLALDSTGRPVVVQIMPRLTAPGLLEALDVAGRASRLTRGDLAAKHPGGPDLFHATLRKFFDAVPVTRHEAPTPGAVRLVIVCADVDAALLPSVEFLRSGAARVQLLRVGLVAGRDGQCLVDVSPWAEVMTASKVTTASGETAASAVTAVTAVTAARRAADQDVAPVVDVLSPPRDRSAVVGPVDSALAELASELEEPLALVWLRHRRGERFEVVLHPDGSLHTAAGVRYADPTWAASAVSGGTASDGWRVWRAGDHGRTLAELRA